MASTGKFYQTVKKELILILLKLVQKYEEKHFLIHFLMRARLLAYRRLTSRCGHSLSSALTQRARAIWCLFLFLLEHQCYWTGTPHYDLFFSFFSLEGIWNILFKDFYVGWTGLDLILILKKIKNKNFCKPFISD